MERIESSDGALFLDAARFPFLIVSWVGEGTVEQADGYVTWVARMAERVQGEGKLSIINDATRAGRPGPEFRKFFSDFLATPEGTTLLTVDHATFVALSNPLVRGALTAIGWMAPSVRSMRVTPDLPTAVAAAVEEARRRGDPTEMPDLAGYEHPADAERAESGEG